MFEKHGARRASIFGVVPLVIMMTLTLALQAQVSGLRQLISIRFFEPYFLDSDWSSSVDGVFSSTTEPSGVTQMRSVNVPPTSTPMR